MKRHELCLICLKDKKPLKPEKITFDHKCFQKKNLDLYGEILKKINEQKPQINKVRRLEWKLSCLWPVSSVTQSCLTLCDPMNCSTPGLPVHHQLPEFAQTHVHQFGDAIQPSHPLLPSSPPAFNLSQNQGPFQ